MNRKIIVILVIVLSVIFFYSFVLPSFELHIFLESLIKINTLLFFLALVTILMGNVAGSFRWSLLMKEVKAYHSQIFFNAIGIFCFGQVAGLIVPSRVGNYTKVPFIVKYDGITYEAGLSAVNAETILDLGYISVAGIISFFIFSPFFASYPYSLSMIIILILVILSGALIVLYKIRHFQGTYEDLVVLSSDPHRNRLIRSLALSFKKMFELIRSAGNIFVHRTSVIKLCCCTLITQFFGVIGLFLILDSVHTPLPLLEVFAILTISYIIGIASLIPGGLGVADLTLIALCGYKGIPLSVATNIAILWRVAIYLPVLVVVGMYFIQKNFVNRKVTE